MILVNKNFGNPVLAEVIGDMFRPTSDDGLFIGNCQHTNSLANGSTLVSTLSTYIIYNLRYSDSNASATMVNNFTMILLNKLLSPRNFFIVTDQFLKVLDKVYTKIWNESFTETGIYNPNNIATIYNGFSTDVSKLSSSTFPIYNSNLTKEPIEVENFMLFKKFVDRCITAGILTEEDRLQYKDQISLNNLNKADLSTQIDLDNKLITFTAAQPIDIAPDLNGLDGEYLAGKKLYLFMTPSLPNESTIKNTKTSISGSFTEIATTAYLSNYVKQEPFFNIFGRWNLGDNTGCSAVVRQPIAFFKPKTDASKFGRSLPLATHLIWSIGTPADEAAAIANNQTPPDLIVDHLDRISHIDSLVLKIKYDKLQF